MFEQVLARTARSFLERLSGIEATTSFYLAGGTGLALQLGHRVSQDLDWFTQDEFDSVAVAKVLTAIGPVQITEQKAGTLVATVEGIEVGFYRYAYPLLFPTEAYRGFAVASWKDILCMKLAAIGQRSAKRDYVDVYFGLRRGLSLEEMLQLMRRKYESVEFSEYHILRSLTYFDEIEAEPMPTMLADVAWDAIRRRLVDEVRRLSER